MKHSLTAQIEEVEREIALRANVYPRQVSSGKMRQSVADEHMKRMHSVLNTLLFLSEHRTEFLGLLESKERVIAE